uniref:TIGR03032 family protein n=1 Tax=Microseira wollei TaxID=467598 RepID=UPI001CFCE137|nr:TIGR03032 family protein [Microseira wollei]
MRLESWGSKGDGGAGGEKTLFRTINYTQLISRGHDITQTSTAPAKSLEINASRQFTPWLFEQNLSLAFTTIQAGKLFFIGWQPDGRLSVFEDMI